MNSTILAKTRVLDKEEFQYLANLLLNVDHACCERRFHYDSLLKRIPGM